jgi:hypothetical protein
MTAVIIHVTSDSMVATVTDVTMGIMATKITDFPITTFATIIVKVIDDDWLLWLREGAITVSLC